MIARTWLACVVMALVGCQDTLENSPKEIPVDKPSLTTPTPLLEQQTFSPEVGVDDFSQEALSHEPLVHQHDYMDDVRVDLERDVQEDARQARIARLYASSLPNLSDTTGQVSHPDSNIKTHRDDKRPQIAIIIDDLGYQRAQGTALLAIGKPLSYAVIPNTPYARAIATDVVGAEQELMLHIPMQTISARKWEQGLTEDMSAETFNAHVDDMLNDYPFAKGINNHGGSLLTQNSEKMQWLMNSLKPRGLFFVDSRTTSASVARDVAAQAGVLSASRDVFLDNDKDADAIAKRFEQVKRLAKRNGHAIAIGHPYPQTITFLAENLPDVAAQGFELVFMSELLHNLAIFNDTKSVTVDVFNSSKR